MLAFSLALVPCAGCAGRQSPAPAPSVEAPAPEPAPAARIKKQKKRKAKIARKKAETNRSAVDERNETSSASKDDLTDDQVRERLLDSIIKQAPQKQP